MAFSPLDRVLQFRDSPRLGRAWPEEPLSWEICFCLKIVSATVLVLLLWFFLVFYI